MPLFERGLKKGERPLMTFPPDYDPFNPDPEMDELYDRVMAKVGEEGVYEAHRRANFRAIKEMRVGLIADLKDEFRRLLNATESDTVK
jgi:hypothetical protein